MDFDILKSMKIVTDQLDANMKNFDSMIVDFTKNATPEVIAKMKPDLEEMQEAVKQANEQSRKVHSQTKKSQNK
tara:strand:+ start:500 stop:721 length:222 start_codon:yes stop_codon:yes gene_type:complete